MEDTAAPPPPIKPAIMALPPPTIKLIGSAQVLLDPSSVVKELIDNALDARASSISVEISSNTIDVIQVRDNGHGIAPKDRAMVARRYCTSKIREFDDLKNVGGRWLGFRGEALASMAEMSGTLSVITRVEGEAVAVLLNVARNGEIAGEGRASHPAGTTVRLTDFLKSLPVRKQAALKHSSKYLAKVKRLLQAYALCRPTTRFSVRVLKAKNDKGSWIYASKSDANVEDAALKVIGRDCASQCEWTVLDSDGIEVQAFLPKRKADASKIGNVGHFISVDSRPVSAVRGTLKQMVMLCTERIRKSDCALSRVKDPFIFMNVVCPSNSYDANIEPAKDDVLFENSDIILGAVRQLLNAFYPEFPAHDQGYSSGTPHDHESTPLPNPRVGTVTVYEDESEVKEPSTDRRRTWRPNMYGIDQEDLDLLAESTPDLDDDFTEDSLTERRRAAVSNPWTIAKMNTPIKAAEQTRNAQLMTPLRERNGSKVDSSSPFKPSGDQQRITSDLLTPEASSPSRAPASIRDKRSLSSVQYLPLAMRSKPTQTTASNRVQNEELSLLESDQPLKKRHNAFQQANEIPLGTQLEDIPEYRPRPRRNPRKSNENVNKPFVPPIREPQDNWFKFPTSRSSQPRRRQKQGTKTNAIQYPDESVVIQRNLVLNAANALFDPGATSRNRDIRDFTVTRLTRQLTSVNDDASSIGSHSQRRARTDSMDKDFGTEAEVPRIRHGPELPLEELNELDDCTISSVLSFTPVNPQAIATSEATVPASHRRTIDHLRRSKSAKLPLERVLSNYQIQNASLVIRSSATAIANTFGKLDTTTNFVDWQEPSDDAYNAFSILPTSGVLKVWSERLDTCLTKTNLELDLVGDLAKLIQSAIDARGNEASLCAT